MFKIRFVKKTRVPQVASSGTSTAAQHVDIEAIKAKLDKRLGRDIVIPRHHHHHQELPRVLQLDKVVQSKLQLDVEASTSVKEAHLLMSSSKLSKRFKLPSLICGTKHIERHASIIESSCDSHYSATSSIFSSSQETNHSKFSDDWHACDPTHIWWFVRVNPGHTD